jgi:hypothetical protein
VVTHLIWRGGSYTVSIDMIIIIEQIFYTSKEIEKLLEFGKKNVKTDINLASNCFSEEIIFYRLSILHNFYLTNIRKRDGQNCKLFFLILQITFIITPH